MRNTCQVLIDQDGEYLAIGVDRIAEELSHFVRLDVGEKAFLIGPTNARHLAELLCKYADQAEGKG